MTTDTEALICDCPAKNMPFGRCCKLEPLTALRAAFESTVSEWGGDTYRNKAGGYATTSTNGAWAGYQAGHAAAKAETAAAVAKERERVRGVCLEIADRYWTKCQNSPDDNVQRLSGISDGASYCADAIRARSDQ